MESSASVPRVHTPAILTNQADTDSQYFGANLGGFPDDFLAPPSHEHSNFRPCPLSLGNRDENPSCPTAGLEHHFVSGLTPPPFDWPFEAQADILEGLEVSQTPGHIGPEATRTQSIGSESTIEGPSQHGDQIPPAQPSFTPDSNGRDIGNFNCHNCGYEAVSYNSLDQHSRETVHASYHCQFPECQSVFTRHDVMKRHRKKHDKLAPTYPCTHCRRYRGANGFKRKDHLTQHTRNYHRVATTPRPSLFTFRASGYFACPKPDCSEHSNRRSEYTEHMRKVHDESEFPCDAPGCNRIGGKGFFREIDLNKHKERMHPVV